MIKAGIIGGSGYRAGELIRLLINHPDVEIQWVHSSTNADKLVSEVHQGLVGDTYIRFTDSPDLSVIDVLFLCTPHGESSRYLESVEIPEELRIIDLSQDYRQPHPAHDFVYGLPELNRKPMVRGARHVAVPGSFATVIELALLPLAKNLLLEHDIHINAIIGSTGAYVAPDERRHPAWQNQNVTVYEPLTHRHNAEIRQTIQQLQPGFRGDINFIPMRGSFSRGIFAVLYMKSHLSAEDAMHMYEEFYSDHGFTFVKDTPVDLKDVVNTNKCLINIDKVDDRLVITAAIDNLLKGASGSAVHAMNLLFGLQERVGLTLKASAF